MRQPVRPFITAYKDRSSKFRTPRPWDIDDPEKVLAKPLSVDFSADASAMSGSDTDYLAAMAAADAVFGGKAVESVALQEPANIPTSRILPCLLQDEAQPSSAAEQTTKARRAPRTVKTSGRKADKPAAINPPIKPSIAKKVVKPSQSAGTPEILNAPAVRRERSSIQIRWVCKTELKPGEKWKRRLCKAAR